MSALSDVGRSAARPERLRPALNSPPPNVNEPIGDQLVFSLLRNHNTAPNPLRSSRFNNFSNGPLGCFSPISHLRTVDALVFNTDASTVWLSFKC